MNNATSTPRPTTTAAREATSSGRQYSYRDGDDLVAVRPDWISDDAWRDVLAKMRAEFARLTTQGVRQLWCVQHADCIEQRTGIVPDPDHPCYSETREVALTLMPATDWRSLDVVENQVVTTYLQQSPSDEQASVHLAANDEAGVAMTLDEAAQLMSQLGELIAEAGR